jgi:hypothetical protein
MDYGTVMQMAAALGIRVDELLLDKIRAYEEEILRIGRERRGGKGAAGPTTCDEKKVLECVARHGEMFDAVCGQCAEQPVKTPR